MLALTVALTVWACRPAEPPPADGSDWPDKEPPTVVLETTMGRIALELNRDEAPNTVDNFLTHVKAGFYDGLVFHRVIRNSIIQTGRQTPEGLVRRSPAPRLGSEANNSLSNVRGTVAMARATGRPHSAKTQFFINLTDNTLLDFTSMATDRGWGYAVFGRVVAGMAVADLIGEIPVHPEGTEREFLPTAPVVIDTAYVVKQPPADS